MTQITKHLRIFGRVQGVYYRAWTVENAQKLGLTGWVRNRKDGSVEALLTGEEGSVDDMIRRCYDGPQRARVETISVHDGTSEHLQDFQFRDTA